MTNRYTMIKMILTSSTLMGAQSLWAIDARSIEPLEQKELNDLVTAGGKAAFEEAFEHGDELFEIKFNAIDGGGANVGQNFPNAGTVRYTRTPRAKLQGAGEWANHFPSRATGPNGQGCADCHHAPFDGAGGIESNAVRDPGHTGNDLIYIQRNTPHLFSPGAIQKLAEEMTEELHAIRQKASDQACALPIGQTTSAPLVAKGTDYGILTITHTSGTGTGCITTPDAKGVKGLDADLVVKPFQWKGSVAFLRDFIRGAFHNEIGMQPVELTGRDVDGDGDGVKNEMSVGDMSASALYLAAQPRPTTQLELNKLGLLDPPLSRRQSFQILKGTILFNNKSLKCASCHQPSKTLASNIFSEPSQNPAYRDGATFPGITMSPESEGVLASKALKFDLTKDQPDNIITNSRGRVVFRLGSLRKDRSGHGVVELFSDLKRHDIGPEMGEPIDEEGKGPTVFLTETLWGVGSTAPYMHDGRASTLSEAIMLHGGEAETSRTAFTALSDTEKDQLLAFLNNLVLFQVPGAED